MTSPLAAAPPNLAGPGGALLTGLWAGRVIDDPIMSVRQRGGRVRRWSYAAAGDAAVQAGAAVVDIGVGATAFVWCCVDGRVLTWDRTIVGGRGVTAATRPSATGSARVGDATVAVMSGGAFRVDVPIEGERLRMDVTASAGSPAVCATRTAGGGWNVTEKNAGYPTAGTVRLGSRRWDIDGAGWSDWTAGRQDRNTSWLWAAAAGTARDGRAVGFNVSTGMNAVADGEDVVWWDGVPYPLDVTSLAPDGDPTASWGLAGPGWRLEFDATGSRAADENLFVLRSRYIQPIGVFTGTLPGPDGAAVPVTMVGVTEDHDARW